jgi:hypothetical protein
VGFFDGMPAHQERGPFVRATFLACGCLQLGSRNQVSNAAQGCSAAECFNWASPLEIVARAVARAVGTLGAKAIASITNAAAETVTAIFLNSKTIPPHHYPRQWHARLHRPVPSIDRRYNCDNRRSHHSVESWLPPRSGLSLWPACAKFILRNSERTYSLAMAQSSPSRRSASSF